MSEKPKPSVGRIVHYQAFGTPGGEYRSEPRAAIITEVTFEEPLTGGSSPDDPQPELKLSTRVGLSILNPTGVFFNRNVPYSDEPKPGHWNWPPRA